MNSIETADVTGKRVIVWAALNAPVEEGRVLDDTRLKAAAETIDKLIKKGASVLLIGHLGRPKGKNASLSLQPVADKLGQILNSNVELIDEIKAPKTPLSILENIRFWPEEEKKNPEFAKKIAKLGHIYVNDCFPSSHHAGATMLFLPKFLPAFAGPNLIREVEELKKLLEHPARPLVSIIGGAKIKTKLPVIDNLAKVSNNVLIGGKLMFEVNIAYLPENVTVAHDDVDKKDIGPKTIRLFKELLEPAKTIIWNGPMGIFEEEKYAVGTKEIARTVADSPAYSVIGGGDSIEALNKFGLLDKINYVSHGGGAMLEFLAGKKLRGIEALKNGK